MNIDLLKIENEEMIKLLLDSNRIDAVRKAVLNNSFDEMIKDERLNFCSDSELREIARNQSILLEVMENYKITEKLIDIIIFEFSDYSQAIKIIISNHITLLKPKHFEVLLKNIRYKALIVDNMKYVLGESLIYLNEKGILYSPTYEQVAVKYGYEVEKTDVRYMTMEELNVVAFVEKFTDEELRFVLDKIFNCKTELEVVGYMHTMLQSQKVPDEYLIKIVTEWDISQGGGWFENMLIHQNLDSVIDYILENKKLTKEEALYVIENTKTSTRKLSGLYRQYSNIIKMANPKRIPVLDVHYHMC